jgi:hypothetical protein
MNLCNASRGVALTTILLPCLGSHSAETLPILSSLLHVIIEYSLSSNTAFNHVQPELSAVKVYGLLPVRKLSELSNHHENWNPSFAVAVNIISSHIV